MKKTFFVIAVLSLSALISYAQKNEYFSLRYQNMWGYFSLYGGYSDYNTKISKAGVSAFVETINDGKKEYKSAMNTFDKNGNTISFIYYNKKGKPRSQYFYSYDSDTNIISQSFKGRNNKEERKINYSYDQFGNTVGEKYFENEKPKAKTVFMYDSARILESYYYKNGSPDYKRKWVYTYYPDKSKKLSVIYNANGKVKHTWNYECKPEGELQSKHKDTTDVCKKEDTDSLGNRILTVRRFNSKGKMYKVVRVFNKENKLIQYTEYNDKDLLNYSYKYDANSQNMLEVIYYSNGREKYKYQNIYDSNNNFIKTVKYNKGKLAFTSEYEYNSMDLMTTYTYHYKDSKKKVIHKYDYLFFVKQ